MVACAELEPQRIDFQFGPNVVWSPIEFRAPWAAGGYHRPEAVSPVRAMYAKLARAYVDEPVVPDHGGGVTGDRFDF